jgi:ABC-2 type transport system ATP-binding protein
MADADRLEIDGISKRFGKVTALDNLKINVPQGQLFGFLGPNGAGKTTTIKIISGLLKPSDGTVRVCGFDVQKEPLEVKRRIGFIPDQPFLYKKLTGRELLRFIGSLYELKNGLIDERSEELLTLFGLIDVADNLVESYSHGMRQKLVMSAALIHRPELLLVDEPFVGLDPRGALLVKKIFRKICEQGVTIFMSTHTLGIAEQLCDRIGIIQHGSLLALGTKDELEEKARLNGSELEEIFLSLTGATDIEDIVDILRY